MFLKRLKDSRAKCSYGRNVSPWMGCQFISRLTPCTWTQHNDPAGSRTQTSRPAVQRSKRWAVSYHELCDMNLRCLWRTTCWSLHWTRMYAPFTNHTRAAHPEEDPPVILVSSSGWTTGPVAALKLPPLLHKFSQTAFPMIRPPASSILVTAVASTSGV